jgi:iron complex outermembrane recepter protein
MKTRMVKMIWVLACAIPINALSQHSIRGTIRNAEGQTLPGVKITLYDTYFGAYSDPNGHFEITTVPANTYMLRASLLGFEPIEREVKVETQDVSLNLVMTVSALMMEEVQIIAVRADSKTPTTYSNLNAAQIERLNTGQDLPYLLETVPSTVVTSDAGAGVGYTGVRIRGVDPTRTNVTVNGIPLNDAESHGVFWVNMPDFASSSDEIQVQRGVGTSSNGAAAFGASINIKTDNIEKKPYAESDNSGGSFNTLRTTLKAGTGLINDRFALDLRLSKIASDGFVDRASSDLKSFYVSGAYVGKKSILKATIFSGKEKTYQAWYGIPQAKFEEDDASLLTHFYNNYYPGGIYETAADSANLFGSGSNTYNYYSYENETDNYQQDHYQLHYSRSLNKKMNLNVAGHYTRGRGYYEQYKRGQDFADYGFEPVIYGADTLTTTDLIRQRWLDNHFYGGIFSVTYSDLKKLKIVMGGGANNYTGKHFGDVIWARTASSSEIGKRYYENDARKAEANLYIKANYELKKFNLFADLQGRYLSYSYQGNDQYFGEIVLVQQAIDFLFFNPKAGLTYTINNQSNIYASYSVANREPVRDDFISAAPGVQPQSERLNNVEAGYRYSANKFFFNGNGYWMDYKDQLILTGKINDVGAYIRTNVDESYRAGVELEAGYKLTRFMSISGNIAFSQNKVVEFIEYVDNYDNYDSEGNMIQDEIIHQNTDLAFSPNVIGSLGLYLEPLKGLEFTLLGKFVGSQYLDNTSSVDRMLDEYATANVGVSYRLAKWGLREIKIGANVNNLLNYRYANNGYTWGYIAGGQRIIENFVYPQAGRNLLVRLTVKI